MLRLADNQWLSRKQNSPSQSTVFAKKSLAVNSVKLKIVRVVAKRFLPGLRIASIIGII